MISVEGAVLFCAQAVPEGPPPQPPGCQPPSHHPNLPDITNITTHLRPETLPFIILGLNAAGRAGRRQL